MNVYVAINAALELVSLGLAVQEVQARIAAEEAKGLSIKELSQKITKWRDEAIAEAYAEIEKLPE